MYYKRVKKMIEENKYDEVDFTLTVKRKDGLLVKESVFNKFVSQLEDKMSREDYLVIVTQLDREQNEIEIIG